MILQQFILVDPADGRIVGHIAGNGQIDMSPHHAGLELYEHGQVDGKDFYLKQGDVVPRPDCPVRLAYTSRNDVVILSGVPAGTSVKIRGAAVAEIPMTHDDGLMRLEFPTHGKYVVSWESFPYRAFEAYLET